MTLLLSFCPRRRPSVKPWRARWRKTCRELGQLETQLLSEHRAAQETLEDRKGLAEHEWQLALKEKEVWLRDE